MRLWVSQGVFGVFWESLKSLWVMGVFGSLLRVFRGHLGSLGYGGLLRLDLLKI